MFQTKDWSAIKMINFLSSMGEFLANSTLSHPNVQNLMKYEKNFDAVVVEVFWTEALYGEILWRALCVNENSFKSFLDWKHNSQHLRTEPNLRNSCEDSIHLFCVTLGLGAHFNCPVIALSTFSTSKWTNDLTKAPMEHSYVAHNFIKFSENMNFYERTLNVVTSQYENIFMEMVHYERQVRWQLKFITFWFYSFFIL